MKKKIVLFIAVILICFFSSKYNVDYAKETLFWDDNVVVSEIAQTNDISVGTDGYIITGADGYIVYKIAQNQYAWNALIEFNEELTQDVSFQIFYADYHANFNEENSFQIIAKQGATNLFLSFPKDKVQYIRVDLMSPKNSEVPFFELVVSLSSLGHYIKSIMSVKNAIQVILSILIFVLTWFGMEKIWIEWKAGTQRGQLAILWVVVTLMFGILYFPFIKGDFVYIYADIGSDTINQYWPKYLFNFNFLSEFGNSGYTLQKGLGEYVAHVSGNIWNPFDWTILFFEESYALIVSLYLKTIWTAGFAWAYFRNKFQKAETVVICSVLWTFSGWVVLWGQHYHFATTYAYITAILFFLELLLKKNKYSVLMPIALALLTGHSYYFTYTIGIFCVVYILIIGIQRRWAIKETIFMIIKLAIMEIIAVFLSAVQLYPAIDTFLHSGRTSALEISLVDLLKPRDSSYLFAYIGRMISSNIWGIQDYSSVLNYYEMAVGYISCLSIIAIVYFLMTKYWKRILGTVLAYTALIMIPLVSKLLQFDAYSFRWTVILYVGELLLIGYFLDELWKKLEEKNISKIHMTLHISNLIMLFIFGNLLSINCDNAWGFHVDLRVIIQVGLVWEGLYLLFVLLSKINNIKVVALCLLLFVSAEQIYMNYEVVNNRGELEKDILNNSYYNDGTEEVIDALQNKDTSLYRVNKTYYSVFYNDSYIQDYYGLASYNSANGNELNEFIDFLQIPKYGNSSNYIAISYSDRFANELLGTKYLVAKQGEEFADGYVEVLSDENYIVYEDTYTLPFGYLYKTQLSNEQVESLNGTTERSAALMIGFYTCEEVIGFDTVELEESTFAKDVENGRIRLKESNIQDIVFLDNTYSAKVKNNTAGKAMMCVPLIYSDRWCATINGDNAECYNINGGLVGIEIPEGEFDVVIEYETIDYDIAMWITIVSTMLYVVYLIVLYIHKKKI